MKYIYLSIILFLTACNSSPKPVSNKAISTQKISQQSVMNILDEADEDETQNNSDGVELYFADTKGKIFYTKHSANKIQFRTKLLLNTLFKEAKSSLPRISRKKRLNISLEIGKNSIFKNDILEASQSFIIENKRYQLANSDEKTLEIVRRVLKEEDDSIYKGTQNIQTKNKSDIILFLDASKNDKKMTIRAKIISKNGTILARRTNETYINNDITKDKEWVEVSVPRNNGAIQTFEILRDAVMVSKYSGESSNKSVSNVSFISASRYCQEKLQAQLVTPYVFENARKSLAISRPTSPVSIEIIAPYDEDEDDVYYIDGDNIEGSDSSIVTYHWNSEKYYSVSNLFKSTNATFRCMRVK